MRRFSINITLSTVFALAVLMFPSAQAQTYQVIHSFTGGQDGGSPYAGLSLDKGGNLYGTTFGGGTSGSGAVFQLKRKNSSFVFNPLYSFAGGSDGANPEARVIFGSDGALYGTTRGGYPNGLGTVFKLRPSPSACKSALCSWTETVLYSFKGGTDGAYPGFGELIFDRAGNIYGTTLSGGNNGSNGTVYQLTPSGSGWTEGVLYRFAVNDGAMPVSGVILDNAGNLYGTTIAGGLSNSGTVFQLTYAAGSGWTETFLYSFRGGNDGNLPIGGLVFDSSGNLYGTTSNGGQGGGGTVFKLTPSGGGWTYSLVYSFTGGYQCGPWGTLLMDGGNLYGTTVCDGAKNAGNVFKLTPSGTYTSLYDFAGGSDGKNPYCRVVFDANGNLYGTAYAGGQGYGVVWEITP
jgi:uncharacterized repeat protein (TIGR03803 family)